MNVSHLRKRIHEAVESRRDEMAALIRDIHGFAEPAMKEVRSSRRLSDFLGSEGFRVAYPYPNIPTAFRAEWGKGKPVIGILGEYDALPDCGPKFGDWGHGCAHDLLGVGAAVGAASARAVMAEGGPSGKIVYYGCPAEETLIGKVYMAREGAFAELDACLSWHPAGKTSVERAGGSAMDSLVYEFFGQASHAAACPAQGRSALDAAILMDVSANYLREHLPENVRIHSVFREGGVTPNVVPAYAKVWFYARGSSRAEVDEVRRRLRACARAASLATDTRFREKRLTSLYPRLRNEEIHETISENLKHFGPPRATKNDREAARRAGVTGGLESGIAADNVEPFRGSTDDQNVSWLTPLGTFRVACYAMDSPAHHRLISAQCLLPFAARGTAQAAKVFAGSALDLMRDEKRLASVRREFVKGTRGFTYHPLIPKRQLPPAELP